MSVALPDKLSDLAELALADLRKCESDERYEVAMKHWHYPGIHGKCLVCFAGAVIAQSLKVSPCMECRPCKMEDKTTINKLRALDHLRTGAISAALFTLGIATDPWCAVVPFYEEHRPGFYAAIEGIIAILRERGL